MPTPRAVSALTPRATAIRPKRRPWLALLKLVGWSVALVAALVGVGIAIYLHPQNVRAARVSADRELRATLEPGETIDKVAFVSQRKWWDYFRETPGLLVTTDRRIIFLGVPPNDLLHPADVPPMFEERAFPFDTTTTLERGRVFLGSARGVVVRTARGDRETFGAPGEYAVGLASLIDAVELRQRTTRETAAREREAELAAATEARRAKYHVVVRGDAIYSIAQLYGTVPESIQAWNGLPTPRIKIGQRLLVKPETK